MSIQNRALLVSLSIGMFSPRKTDKKVTREVLDAKSAGRDAGRFVKAILPEEALKPHKKIEGEARAYHEEVTCPWTDDGVRILPSVKLLDYTEMMRRLRRRYDAATDEFLPSYEDFKKEGQRLQGDMYNADDYPSADRVKSKFYFKTSLLPFPAGEDFRVDVGEDIMAELRDQVEVRVKEASDIARRDLWQRLETPLRAMAERLAEEKPVFRDTLVTNLTDIVGLIPALNITNDPKLEAIRRDIQQRLNFGPESLRRSASKRREAAAKANDILKNMAGYFQSADAPSAPAMELPEYVVPALAGSEAPDLVNAELQAPEPAIVLVDDDPELPTAAEIAAITAPAKCPVDGFDRDLGRSIRQEPVAPAVIPRPPLPAWRTRLRRSH